MNVVLYGKGARWTMTDRGRSALGQTEDVLTIGPSALYWDGGKLVIDINEISTPHCNRIKGKVTIRPTAITPVELPLTQDGSHVWRPFAPTSDISVELNRSGWTWDGHGYFDANFGTRALEDDFSYWTWARLPHGHGTACLYDADRRDGTTLAAGVKFDADGSHELIDLPEKKRFKRSLWALRRETRSDPGYQPKQVKHMLDAPFYNRCAIKTKIDGQETIGVHEALDLNRFRSPFLKPMLAVRVPRRPHWP